MANMDKVRVEMEAIRQQKGLWLEKFLVPLVLVFSPKKAKTLPKLAPNDTYVETLRPLIRWWTLFDGAWQLFMLMVASIFGLPIVGWLWITLVTNGIMIILVPLSMRAHAKALAASPSRELA